MSQVGTAGQATQLATLQTARDAARATYDAAVTSLKTAQTAMINADKAFVDYQNFYFGNAEKPGVVDGGNTDVV